MRAGMPVHGWVLCVHAHTRVGVGCGVCGNSRIIFYFNLSSEHFHLGFKKPSFLLTVKRIWIWVGAHKFLHYMVSVNVLVYVRFFLFSFSYWGGGLWTSNFFCPESLLNLDNLSLEPKWSFFLDNFFWIKEMLILDFAEIWTRKEKFGH